MREIPQKIDEFICSLNKKMKIIRRPNIKEISKEISKFLYSIKSVLSSEIDMSGKFYKKIGVIETNTLLREFSIEKIQFTLNDETNICIIYELFSQISTPSLEFKASKNISILENINFVFRESTGFIGRYSDIQEILEDLKYIIEMIIEKKGYDKIIVDSIEYEIDVENEKSINEITKVVNSLRKEQKELFSKVAKLHEKSIDEIQTEFKIIHSEMKQFLKEFKDSDKDKKIKRLEKVLKGIKLFKPEKLKDLAISVVPIATVLLEKLL